LSPCWQLPLAHRWPTGQTLPQAPQLLQSVLVLASHPLAAWWSQLVKPVLQEATVQAPAVQAEMALGRLHAALHPEQLLVVPSIVSQPLLWSPSQSAKPAAQAELQRPAWHVGVVFGGTGQTWWQKPQLSTSELVSVQVVAPLDEEEVLVPPLLDEDVLGPLEVALPPPTEV
jgi:hypothetical protein